MKNSLKTILVKPVYKQFLVPLTKEEYNLLEQSILKEGCKDPLVVWKHNDDRILIDGHNRYSICSLHEIPFEVKELEFDGEEAAKQWMIINQLGRRNLTQDQASYYRGLRYLQSKSSKGGYDKVLKKGDKEGTTSSLLAKEFNVSESTIKRDAAFAKAVEMIGNSNSELRLAILQGQTSIPKKDIQFLSKQESLPRLKNEADLYNKIFNLKKEVIDKVEDQLNTIESEIPQTEEEIFPDFEARISRIKSLVISHMNNAIEKRNINSISKLREVIDQLEVLLSE